MRPRRWLSSTVVLAVLTVGAPACAAIAPSGPVASPASRAGALSSAPTAAVPATTLRTAGPAPRPSTRPAARPTTAGHPRGVVTGVFAAAGVRQWIHCEGVGRVTLVVVPGLGATAASWSGVLPAFERLTRTCAYDRPGLGRSPARPVATQTVDAGLYARELTALLAAAGEQGPFVVVGHSFGGLVARAFVLQERPTVRGLLLAESVTPDDPTTGPYWAEAGHRVSMSASTAATGGGPHLGSLPLLVLSASDPEGDHLGGLTYGQPEWMVTLWRDQQRADSALSSDAIQVIARSGHVLQQDNPDAVVDAVRVLLRAVSTGRALRCSDDWTADGATCR